MGWERREEGKEERGQGERREERERCFVDGLCRVFWGLVIGYGLWRFDNVFDGVA